MRIRVKEIRHIPASLLKANPANWRVHGEGQRKAMRGALKEIGFADVLKARELPDGQLELLDGHLRTDLADDAVVPVAILDLNDQEAKKFLASFDPISAMADRDQEQLDELLRQIQSEDEDFAKLLADQESAESSPKVEEVEVKPPPKMAWVLLGIPLDRYGEARPFVTALEDLSEVHVQTTGDA